jgi:hypothetical protein
MAFSTVEERVRHARHVIDVEYSELTDIREQFNEISDQIHAHMLILLNLCQNVLRP